MIEREARKLVFEAQLKQLNNPERKDKYDNESQYVKRNLVEQGFTELSERYWRWACLVSYGFETHESEMLNEFGKEIYDLEVKLNS